MCVLFGSSVSGRWLFFFLFISNVFYVTLVDIFVHSIEYNTMSSSRKLGLISNEIIILTLRYICMRCFQCSQFQHTHTRIIHKIFIWKCIGKISAIIIKTNICININIYFRISLSLSLSHFLSSPLLMRSTFIRLVFIVFDG